MISLFLDTSNKYITLAIFKDNIECYLYHEKIKKTLSVEILPLIENALADCSIKTKDINKIYVSTGPGSFTGIRIGLTIMKVMAWSLNIDIVPISSLELLATTNFDTDYIIPYIDARRGNCFIAIYDNNLNTIKPDQFVNFNSFMEQIDHQKTFKIVSYDDLEYSNVIVPKLNVEKIIEKHKNDRPVNPHSINPNYLKATEAEENLKRKND